MLLNNSKKRTTPPTFKISSSNDYVLMHAYRRSVYIFLFRIIFPTFLQIRALQIRKALEHK